MLPLPGCTASAVGSISNTKHATKQTARSVQYRAGSAKCRRVEARANSIMTVIAVEFELIASVGTMVGKVVGELDDISHTSLLWIGPHSQHAGNTSIVQITLLDQCA